MNDLDGRICEQGVGCPGNMQVMCDVALGFCDRQHKSDPLAV
jgi:hypothetical protein